MRHFNIAIWENREIRESNAMLHEAIFLEWRNNDYRKKKHCKLQRGCHTLAIFLRNLQHVQRPRWKSFTTISPVASLKRPASKRRALISSFSRNCVAGCDGHDTCCKLSRNVAKSWAGIVLLFLQLETYATSCCIADCKNGVLHVKSFLQLTTQRFLRHITVARKISPCNMAFSAMKISCNWGISVAMILDKYVSLDKVLHAFMINPLNCK